MKRRLGRAQEERKTDIAHFGRGMCFVCALDNSESRIDGRLPASPMGPWGPACGVVAGWVGTVALQGAAWPRMVGCLGLR